jgi:cytidylate kinase
MYRAVAWAALHGQVPLDDEAKVRRLAEASDIQISGTEVKVDGVDVTREIRTPTIDLAAASVARLREVRAVLVERQRRMGDGGGVVMEGRDIGTVVFPHAEVKIYLDAKPEERARRRASDPAHTGGPATVSEVASLLTERDRSDSTRTASPLYAAPDAIVIDTTEKSIDQVVDEVMSVVHARFRNDDAYFRSL